MVLPGRAWAAAVVAVWEERGDLSPLGIRQFIAMHQTSVSENQDTFSVDNKGGGTLGGGLC